MRNLCPHAKGVYVSMGKDLNSCCVTTVAGCCDGCRFTVWLLFYRIWRVEQTIMIMPEGREQHREREVMFCGSKFTTMSGMLSSKRVRLPSAACCFFQCSVKPDIPASAKREEAEVCLKCCYFNLSSLRKYSQSSRAQQETRAEGSGIRYLNSCEFSL